MAQPMPEPDGICHACSSYAPLRKNNSLDPGIYLERHAIVADADNELFIMNHVGVLEFGNVDVTDPQAVEDLAAWLTKCAAQMRKYQAANPYDFRNRVAT